MPDLPGEVARREPADRQHVAHGPRRRRDAERGVVGRHRLGLRDHGIDAVDEAVQPRPGGVRQRPLERRDRPREADDAQAPVGLDRDVAEQLRQGALGDAPHDVDLEQPQVAVHDAEPDREVAIVPSLDVGHLVVVPVDGDRRLGRQLEPGDRREPVGSAQRGRPAPGRPDEMAAEARGRQRGGQGQHATGNGAAGSRFRPLSAARGARSGTG
jgi:hypothetical protein